MVLRNQYHLQSLILRHRAALKDTCECEESLERNNRKTQTIQTFDVAANKIDAFLKQNQPRMGKGKRSKEVKSNITDPESAKMTIALNDQRAPTCTDWMNIVV